MARILTAPPRTPALLIAAVAAVAACAPPTPAPAPAPAPGAAAPPAGVAGAEPAAWSWAAAFPDADTVAVTALTPGVRHVRLWLGAGPWAVHVVEVDRGVCAPAVTAAKAGPPLEGRATTSALAGDALAAINADFFMLPGGTTVGPHVRAGRVLVGPGARPAYLIDAAGGRWAGPASLRGWAAVPGDTARLAQVNRPLAGGRHHPPAPGLTLFDAWFGAVAPVDSGGLTVGLRRIDGAVGSGAEGAEAAAAAEGAEGAEESAGGRVWRGVVASRYAPGDSVPLDGGHAALQATGATAAAWLARRAPGDTVAWSVAVVPSEGAGVGPAVEAVGGFPLLVAGGRGVYAEQAGVIESFGNARHPRTAVAWEEPAGRVLWVVVDGRQSPYSDGMTLAELEGLLLRMGATEGINLDGGGSTAMVVRGRVVNRPSDEEGERPVGNALVLERCPVRDPAASSGR